ncbi:MAG: hypothetical protein EXR72_12160 [Myxococcales bacterium]|nr:hypothetical protein [Myxococcales bacterium]
MRPTLLFAILPSVLGLGCSRDSLPPRGIDLAVPVLGDGGTSDLSVSVDQCDEQHSCPPGKRCFNNQCIPDNGVCQDDNQCQNDTYCVCANGGGDAGPCIDGACIPWGTGPRGAFDPDCQGMGFSASQFKAPVVKCHWQAKAGDSNVLVTPIVVDLDKDGKPEIVFATHSQPHPIAIRGSDCTEVWNRPNIALRAYTQLAAGDLDGDGFPEIVALSAGGVLVLDHDGNKLASSSGGTFGTCSGPAIANIDGVGPPEIGVDGAVYRYTKGQAALQQLFQKPVTAATWGNVSLFADMDGDGKPELVTGLQVYDGATGADKTPAGMKALGSPGGYPAIADFNGDGKPDIVNVQSATGKQQVSVFDYANNKVIFGPYKVAGGGWGGTPTVGDYDGDGVPDFGLASTDHYYVYAMKCAKMPKPADCLGPDPGVLWSKPTHDVSSGGTGSSTFDFNGDSIPEVVYRDECWLRVYNGPDGKAVFAQTITSGTCLEYPVIADVDNDGHADVVVPSDDIQKNFSTCQKVPEADTNAPWGGYTSGIFVLTDPMNRWMPSRPLWTSHTYHITEVKDDLSVPTSEKPNWASFNNYRKNVQGAVQKAIPAPDLTGGIPGLIDNGGNDCKVAERLWANLCNRGATPAGPGVPGTFYTSDPRQPGAQAICGTKSTQVLQPGACEAVFCDWQNPPMGPRDLWYRADDDGVKKNVVSECKNENDLLFLPQVTCAKIG